MEDLLQSTLAWASTLKWIDAVEAVFVSLSMIGQHFNAKRDARGFHFWIVSNVGALVMFASLGRWMTCVLYLYYTYKCWEGIRTWKTLEQQPTETGLLKTAPVNS